MNKLTRMLLLQYAANATWDIQSFQVQTAFLRISEQSGRILGMEPPEEMRQRLKLQAKFPFGARKSHNFVFTGLKISHANDYSITIDQSQCVRDSHAISLSHDRRSQPDHVAMEE